MSLIDRNTRDLLARAVDALETLAKAARVWLDERGYK